MVDVVAVGYPQRNHFDGHELTVQWQIKWGYFGFLTVLITTPGARGIKVCGHIVLFFPNLKSTNNKLVNIEDIMSSTPKNHITKALMVCLATCGGYSSAALATVEFAPTTDKLEFVRESFPNGGEGLAGSAWFDYNNDGWEDVYLTNGIGNKNALFKNERGRFVNVTDTAGVGHSGGTSGVVAADLNNDGFPDLFLTGEGGAMSGANQTPTVMYKNNGDGTFTAIDTDTAGIPGPKSAMMSTMGDIDNDGDLDIFVTAPSSLYTPDEYHMSKLYRNDGDFKFTDITEEAGVIARKAPCVAGFSDYDKDGDTDLFVGNCNDPVFGMQPIQLFRNEGNSKFTDQTDSAGLTNVLGFWMSLSFGDLDNDGDIDFFSGSAGNSMPMYMPHAIMINNGDGTFTDIGDEMGVANQRFSWGSALADFDNNGYNDLFFTGSLPIPPFFNAIGEWGNPGLLFFNQKTEESGIGMMASHGNLNKDLSAYYTSGVSAADYNNDGDVDFLVMTEKWFDENTQTQTDGKPIFYVNKGNNNRSTSITLKGVQSNRDAVGARVEVVTTKTRQTKEIYAGSGFLSSDSKRLTFGVDKIRFNQPLLKVAITWPSGCKEEYLSVRFAKDMTFVEGQPVEKGEGFFEKYQFYFAENCG